jgi:hypothetical protein
MRSFDECYDSDALRTFTAKERARLRALHRRLDDNRDEMRSFLAKWLYGGAYGEEEASHAKRLASEHRSISKAIMDIWRAGEALH